MVLIFLAALCSVAVSILLKQLKLKGFEPLQLIIWNYFAASLLCLIWFKPDLSQVFISSTSTPWWLIIALGLIFPSIFLCLAQSLHYSGIIKTEIAQRLSVVLSLLAAYFIFNETFTSFKIFGIALGVVAVLCLVFAKSSTQTQPQKGKGFLLAVWVGYALVDVLLKYNSSLGQSFTVSLNLIFIVAFIFSLLWKQTQQQAWQFKNLPTGLLLGCLNFANIALYVQAHQLLKDSPAIVFMTMNISVVVLGVVGGMLWFKEKPNALTLIGLLLGLSGVICLAGAMA